MKEQKLICKLTAWAVCLVMIVSLFAVAAFAAGPYYGTSPCPCGATAHWMDPGVSGTPQRHIVNGLTCIYTRWVGYQGLVCPVCGQLVREVPVDYETGHNHVVETQPGQKIPDVQD